MSQVPKGPETTTITSTDVNPYFFEPSPGPERVKLDEPGPVPAASTSQPKPGPSAWLVQKAEGLGLPSALIAGASDEVLSRAVIEQMGRLSAERSAPRVVETVSNPVQISQTPAEESAFDWGEMDDRDDAGRPVKRKVSRDDLHPAIANVIERQDKQIRELKKALEGMTRGQQESAEQSFVQRLDAAFSKSPELFGAGSGESLKGTAEFARRQVVYQQIMAMPPESRRGMTVEQAVDAVAKTLFGKGAAKPIRPSAEEWNEGAVAVPTQRKGGGEPEGRDRAISSVSEYLRETGGAPGTSLDEFLP